ncbi:MAG: hypothetical protein ABIJ56_00940 [Pseudomonadota bacterium]
MTESETRIVDKFEEAHPDGATSIEIIAALAQVGLRISEATLRKYIQVDLLPRSRRVGTKGRHKGSWGLYPSWTIRQVFEIKKLLSEGRTLGEIADGTMGIFTGCRQAAAGLRGIEKKLDALSGRENIDSMKVGEIRKMIGKAADLADEAARKSLGGKEFIDIAI